jgi:hypothetical protein
MEPLENSPWTEGTWSEYELERVVFLFPHVEDSAHEHNPLIQQLAMFLGRKTRSVEAQLLMCRNLQKDSRYPWGNMNQRIPEIWERRHEIWEQGLAGIRPDGTIDADYVPDTSEGTPDMPSDERLQELILEVLRNSPDPLKAIDIASTLSEQLGSTITKRKINPILYALLDDQLIMDGRYRWSLIGAEDETVGPPPTKHEGSEEDSEMGPFSRLLQRSFGGEDVAIAPGADIDPFWPTGPSAVGAMDVCERLAVHLRESVDQVSEWVFLVGGAGNGKSFLANHVVVESECELVQDIDDGLAKRVYIYCSPTKRPFRLVNDATIPPAEQGTEGQPSLCADLLEAIELRQDVLACVNRGILIGEQQEIEEGESSNELPAAIKSLISWLTTSEIPSSTGQEDVGNDIQLRLGTDAEGIPLQVQEGYYAAVELVSAGNLLARVHLLNMDYASLFEPVPLLENERSIQWDENSAAPRVAKYDVLQYGKDREGRRQSPAYKVLRELLGQFDEIDVEKDDDPLHANLAMLRNEGVCEGLTEIFRAAEIVSGQRFTYRELWGLLCIALTGYVRKEFLEFGDEHVPPEQWYERELAGQADDELFFLVSAAMQRTHMSLFGGEIPRLKVWNSLPRFEPTFPSASRWLKEVDPSIDTLRDWGEDVHQAMMSIRLSEEQRPSEYLFAREPLVEHAWHRFDTRLETEILARIRHRRTSDPDRRLLQGWYGSYLFRLYGLACGLPAFSETVTEWTENWRAAQRGQPPTPRFSQGLETLLTGGRANGSAGDRIYLPLFATRTTPISTFSEATIAVEFPVRNFRDFGMTVRGDNLALFLHGLHNSQGDGRHEIIIDFALCRDALCCSSGELGFTDNSHKTAPRVERMRAALLSEARARVAQQQNQQSRHGVYIRENFHAFKDS